MSKPLLLIGLILIFPSLGSPTCIVIYKSENKFYIAADSRVVVYDIIKKRTEYKTSCKIYKGKNAYYGIAGLDDYMVDVSIVYFLKNQSDIRIAITQSKDSLVKYFKKRLKTLKVQAPAEYASYVKAGVVSEIAIMYYKNSVAVLDELNILVANKKGVIDVEGFLVPDVENSLRGSRSNIVKLNPMQFRSVSNWADRKIENLVDSLLKIELKNDTVNVGKPIDLLIYSPNQYLHRLSPKRDCYY